MRSDFIEWLDLGLVRGGELLLEDERETLARAAALAHDRGEVLTRLAYRAGITYYLPRLQVSGVEAHDEALRQLRSGRPQTEMDSNHPEIRSPRGTPSPNSIWDCDTQGA